VAHIIGRGAPELVRFWSEAPARARAGRDTLRTREARSAGAGVSQQIADAAYLRRDVQFKGAAKGAHERSSKCTPARANSFSTSMPMSSRRRFSRRQRPGQRRMRFDDVRASFVEFVKHKNLLDSM